jgi:hypothetical protein
MPMYKMSYVRESYGSVVKRKKGKTISEQAVEAHRFVRRQGSHTFSRQSAHRWW